MKERFSEELVSDTSIFVSKRIFCGTSPTALSKKRACAKGLLHRCQVPLARA